MTTPTIDAARLLADLRALAAIGGQGAGVSRPAYSATDVEARRWLAQKFAAAGLEPQTDRAGNVFGRWPGVARALLIGSHSDTVPNGGWLDGALGVIYALEIARALNESNAVKGIGVDAASFADEEGTFAGFIGSLAFCGSLDPDNPPDLRDAGGRTLADALAPFRTNPKARIDPARTIGYLEAHIEQGPRLEAQKFPIGVVSAIVGIRTRRLHFMGRADHAGTTPMTMRKDASRPLFALVSRLTVRFEKNAGPDTVWNFGSIAFRPGASNVVPAEADVSVQYRDSDSARLSAFDAMLDEEIAAVNATEPGACTMTTMMKTEPVPMDDKFRAILREASAARKLRTIDLPSGAGHDAAMLAAHVPSAMLFIPSKSGRSHSPDEDSSENDIVNGAQVLLDATLRIIRK